MENQQQQNQGGDPAPQPARRKITEKDQYLAYEGLRHKPQFLRLPKRAPAVTFFQEGTTFTFDKEKHKTGDDLGDLLKRRSFYLSELVGDKRRQILHHLPMTKKKRSMSSSLKLSYVGGWTGSIGL